MDTASASRRATAAMLQIERVEIIEEITGRERGIAGGQSGMVTALQRAGSGLNVNLHFHTLVLDGVFTEELGGELVFHRRRRRATPRSRRRSR